MKSSTAVNNDQIWRKYVKPQYENNVDVDVGDDVLPWKTGVEKHVAENWKSALDAVEAKGFKLTSSTDKIGSITSTGRRVRNDVKNAMLDEINHATVVNPSNDRHRVVKVADGIAHTYYNSVNILTGDQGAGKTFTALLECLLVAKESKNTTLLIFIKRKDYDPSYESVKPLF